MIRKKPIILFAALLLFLSGMLLSQEQAGEVIGTIVLEDGSAIPGVAVEATGSNLVGKRITVSNEHGVFRLMALPPGTYEFTFILEGFKTQKQKGVKLEIGRTYKLDVVMETGELREEVVVTGQAPVLDVRKSSTTTNISKQVFDKLPKGRNFTSIITTQPGLNSEREFQRQGDDGTYYPGYSFDGASSSENTFYVDGVDTTTLYEGDAGANVNFDFIEEVQVKSSGYAAEYGGSMGGVISVITRSGGNEFHGQVVSYFDGDMLGHSLRPSLRKNPFNDDISEYATYPEDKWNRIEVGFGLGGYIVKDKLWFFGSFMPRFETTTRRSQDYLGRTSEEGEPLYLFLEDPTFSGEFTKKENWYAASLKLTGQVANNLRVSVYGTLDFYKWKGALPDRDGSGNIAMDFGNFGWEYPKFTIGGNFDYTLGNNLMINGSVGFYQSDRKQMLGPTENRQYHVRTNANVPGAVDIKPGYWYNYGYYDGFQTQKDLNNKLTVTGDATYYANFGGEHVFKAGFQMVRVGVDKDDTYPYDYNLYYWGDNYPHSDGTYRQTTLGYVHVRDPFGVIAKVNSTRWAVYLQDSWTIGDKLTLNLGVRFEKEDIPPFAPGYDPPVTFDFMDKFAPRVGFAYDVFGDSSLKIFGSAGIYYDVMKLEMAEGSYGGFKWLSSYYDIVNPDWNAVYSENMEHPLTGGYAGGEYYETRNWREVSYDTTQPDMKPYQKNEFTFGAQKKLGEDWSISARFLHNYIVNAIEDIGILIGPSEHYYNGNPGSDWIQSKYDEAIAAETLPPGVKATKAVREYTSVTLNLDRRFQDNWLGGVSYTWSRLWGNFAGLASSDEHGRQSPSVERYYDGWFLTYNQYGEDYLGYLMTDRTHQFKAYGAYSFNFGLTIGFNAYLMSGNPSQVEVGLNDMQGYYPLGRNSEGRLPWLWEIDLYAEYNLKLSDKYTLNFNINVSNITNNDITTRIYRLYNQQTLRLPDQTLLDGWNYMDEVAAQGVRLDPRYGRDYWFLNSISARIGIKLLF
jgi:hypothetical protein